MKFEGFLHLNIRCSPEDIPAIERFYGDVLGLQTGYRPNFKFGGIWLYDGDDPVIHVSARFPQGSIVKDKHTGSVDHVAFKASGAVEFRKHLKKLGIDFEEQNIENAGYQVFIYDPVGTKDRVQLPQRARCGCRACRHDGRGEPTVAVALPRTC
jgi:catechol 2,3-dioxygenase-like lactoylglutathione lyase family enzyme